MGKFIDRTGKSYGWLHVIRLATKEEILKENKNVLLGAYWLCKCVCGTEKIVCASSLAKGTKSCGCLIKVKNNQRKKKYGEASFNALYRKYRNKATERGIKFLLSKRLFASLTKQKCHYCGCEPNQIFHYEKYNGDYIYNGVDRIDSNKGYTKDNVVACCGRCNEAKMAETMDDFLVWIDRVYYHIHQSEIIEYSI